jgi:Spy/CpxP family protein refolding chaperone
MKTKLIKKIVTLTIMTIAFTGVLSVGATAAPNQDGHAQTGWIQDGDKWYYLNPDGEMRGNTVIDGYQVGPDGAWAININVTTDAAVNISITQGIDDTTPPAVSITTAPSVDLSYDSVNDADSFDMFSKEQKQMEQFFDETQKELDEQAQKIEEEMNRVWNVFNR